MKFITVGIPSLLAASLFAGAAAVAADAAPASSAPKATSSAPAAQSSAGRVTAAPAQNAVRGSEIGVRKLVCLNMSLQCFSVTPSHANGARLDLKAPDIRRVVSEVELRQRLDEPYELREQQEQVQVEGSRPDPYLPVGIASLPWAVMHPTQAWRILLPVPTAK
jgi:hypothetical protein